LSNTHQVQLKFSRSQLLG